MRLLTLLALSLMLVVAPGAHAREAEPHEADMLIAWQVVERVRTVAYGTERMVRIKAMSSERTIFEVAYDGETTWTQDGVMPKAEADAYWSNNFGFGIIRSAQFAWLGKVAN